MLHCGSSYNEQSIVGVLTIAGYEGYYCTECLCCYGTIVGPATARSRGVLSCRDAAGDWDAADDDWETDDWDSADDDWDSADDDWDSADDDWDSADGAGDWDDGWDVAGDSDASGWDDAGDEDTTVGWSAAGD